MANQPYSSLMMSSIYTPEEGVPEFVNVDMSKYSCVLCGKLLREPLQTECGHRVHKTCLEERLENSTDKNEEGETGFQCPVGEEDCVFVTKNSVNPDFSVIREINQLNVYCTYKSRGCEVEVQLRKLKAHQSECEYRPKECRYRSQGCVDDISFKDLEQHQQQCQYRPTECKHCHQNVPIIHLQNHLERECSSAMVDCPHGCGAKNLRRAKLRDHMLECPYTCKFYDVGCKEKGNPQHMKQHEIKDAASHVELVMVAMARLKLENAKLRTEFETVNDELDKAKALLIERNEEIEALRRQLEQFDHKLVKHVNEVEGHMKEYSARMVQMESKLGEVEKLSKDVTQVRQHQAEIDSGIKDLTASSRSAVQSMGDPATLNAQLRKQGGELQYSEDKIERISLRMQCIETTSYDGILIWKISDYTRRMKQAIDQEVVSLYSQPFYTGRFGYKMCARLYLNGDGVGRGSHMSLFFVIMKGEYDNILRWPFTHRVTLMLLNQRDLKTHIVDTFRPDLESSSFQKPTGPRNVASGCPMFVSHEKLRANDSYIQEDALFIKVVVDRSDYLGT